MPNVQKGAFKKKCLCEICYLIRINFNNKSLALENQRFYVYAVFTYIKA